MDVPSLNNLSFTSFAGIAAIGAIIATCWRYIATGLRYAVGLVIGTAVINSESGNAVSAFAFKNAMRSPFGIRFFGGYESYVHPKKWIECVGYEGISKDPMLIKYKKSIALISMTDSKVSDSFQDHDSGTGKTVTVRYLRWFFKIEDFIVDALDYYNLEKRTGSVDKKQKKKNNRRFKIVRFAGTDKSSEGKSSGPAEAAQPSNSHGHSAERMIMTGVYRLLKWERTDLQMQIEEGQSPFTGYPFPAEIASSIKELECWLANESWFRSKSIPWRRGWLLHGMPGTGKSTLTRAIGMSFDLPVFIFDLANMTNNDFIRAWDEMMSNTPCIALIEDIDNIFNGRKYIGSDNTTKSHLSFDCLINCISGVKQSDGVFLIITTNHIESIDKAIGIPDKSGKSSRPGRIDKAIYLGLMEEEQRLLLAKHILSDYPELIEETVKLGHGETAAQFQARCAELAIGKFWNDKRFIGKIYTKDEIQQSNKMKLPPPPSNPGRYGRLDDIFNDDPENS
jgi:hypothetical protein